MLIRKGGISENLSVFLEDQLVNIGVEAILMCRNPPLL
jgi:hypothetical protein